MNLLKLSIEILYSKWYTSRKEAVLGSKRKLRKPVQLYSLFQLLFSRSAMLFYDCFSLFLCLIFTLIEAKLNLFSGFTRYATFYFTYCCLNLQIHSNSCTSLEWLLNAAIWTIACHIRENFLVALYWWCSLSFAILKNVLIDTKQSFFCITLYCICHLIWFTSMALGLDKFVYSR